jgi:S1-C subfamily serine protease
MKKLNLLLLIILPIAQLVSAQNEQIYKNSVSACVTIYGIYYDNRGNPEAYSIGTGFFTGNTSDGIFCTAFHVVKGAHEVLIDYGYSAGTIPSDYINLTRVYPLERKKKYYWIDDSRDLIIFKLPELYAKNSLELDRNLPSPGEAIHTIGNTFGDYTMKMSSGQVSQIREGSLMKWIVSEFTGLGGGNSGGPVFNKNGSVIGLIDLQDTRNNTIIWIVPSVYISYLLEDIKTRGDQPDIDKQLDDFVVTPDVYSNLKPYDGEKFKKK